VMSTIRYFREEYEAHILEKRCPALMCNQLVRYWIDEEKCVGCGLCEKSCPAGAVSKVGDKLYEIDESKCIKCNACFAACPEKFSAVQKTDATVKTAEMAA